MLKIVAALGALAFGAALAPSAQAQSIVNGNFAGATPTLQLTGWTVAGSGAVTGGNSGGQYVPNTFADFGSGSTTGGDLFQTFQSVAGTNYILSFQYGAFGAGNGSQQLTYSIFGTSTSKSATISADPDTSFTDGFLFSPVSIKFTGDGSLTAVAFLDSTLSQNASSADGLVTAVKLTVVPEPISIALLMTGVVGLAAVRMRKSA